MNIKHALTIKGLSALILGVTVMTSSCKKDESELKIDQIGTTDSTLSSTAKTDGLTMGTLTPTSTSGLIFESLFDKDQTGFNSWEGGDWNGVEAATSESITRSTEQVKNGSHSAKFVLNKSDAGIANNKQRAELTDWQGRMLDPRSERWYGLSMFLPTSYIADPCEEQLFQWHSNSGTDLDGVSMINSPMAMYTKNGRWQFAIKFQGTFDLGAHTTNVWTDWVLHIKFSPDGINGIVEIWKDGVLVLSKTGKNTYNDVEGNYTKIGIYKYGWADGYPSTTTTRTLYYDEVRVGNKNSSYAQVAPRSKSTTPTEPTPTEPTPTEPTPTPSNPVVFAVNAGGRTFTASNGITYQADKYYSGGSTFITSSLIANTADDVLYQAERYGKFKYAVPLTNGTYEITFKFAEIYHKSSNVKRQFDILVENKEVISNLNIFSLVGSFAKYDVVKTVTVTDGILNIQTRTDIDNAKLSAFHIIKK